MELSVFEVEVVAGGGVVEKFDEKVVVADEVSCIKQEEGCN